MSGNSMLKRMQELGVFEEMPLIPLTEEMMGLKNQAQEAMGKVAHVPHVKLELPSKAVLEAHLSQAEAQNRMMLEEAIANQKYYLEMAAKTGSLWYLHPKQPGQYSEFLLISPDMAVDLMKRNDSNRGISPRTSDAYARDMANNNWLQTGESIKINTLGKFPDGQHRILAIIQNRNIKPEGQILYVTFQVPPEAQLAQDSGRPRPVNEKLKMLFGKEKTKGSKIPSICKAMMAGSAPRTRKFTEFEVASFMEKHYEVANLAFKSMPNNRADVCAALAKALLWFGDDKVQPFIKRMHDVMFIGMGDPCRTLYEWIGRIKGKTGVSPIAVYRKTAQAIDCFINEKPCFKLTEKEDDFFEWENNWSVPNHD
jgi:hypothetical protein